MNMDLMMDTFKVSLMVLVTILGNKNNLKNLNKTTILMALNPLTLILLIMKDNTELPHNQTDMEPILPNPLLKLGEKLDNLIKTPILMALNPLSLILLIMKDNTELQMPWTPSPPDGPKNLTKNYFNRN